MVSIDELLNAAWAGVTVSQDSVYQAVASLRRQLGDDSKEPKYIETVPRLGYRLVAQVALWVEPAGEKPAETRRASEGPSALTPAGSPAPGRRFNGGLAWAAGLLACLVLGVGAWAFLFHRGATAEQSHPPDIAIAVLPFLDLTEGMKEEEFADGMTEELIGRLSKTPGLRVPAPTSTFFFKGKQVAPAEIAKTLGVAFLLDGSVRKSGQRVRVAARLLRADNGYVVWTETYDRPFGDILMVQDDIAGEVAKALKAPIRANVTPTTDR